MDQAQALPPQNSSPQHVPEKYLIAFVIQGDDVFKITADNIIHTTGTADGPAFDAIAKLKAAAALLELTNRHKERPNELRRMARELAGEGMQLMARASSSIRPMPVAPPESPEGTKDDGSAAASPVAELQVDARDAQPALTEMVEAQTDAQFAPVLRPRAVPPPEERSPASVPVPGSPRIALISS